MEFKVNIVNKKLLLPLLPLLFYCLFSTSVYSQEKVYSIGVVPQFETRRLHSIWNPILEYLIKETGLKFQLIGAPTISDFEIAFMKGEYDFAYMNPYHFIMANDLQGYLPLVRDVGKKLQGVLVVKKDSGINNVSELDGKVIAFPSPNALGASLQMRQELHDDFSITIQPSYVNSHDSVYLNVLLGEAIAGGGVKKTLNKQALKYQDSLKIIHKTRPVASHPIVVNPQLAKSVRDKVLKALLNMGKTKSGMILLEKIPIKQIGVASLDDYLPLKLIKLDRFYVKPE